MKKSWQHALVAGVFAVAASGAAVAANHGTTDPATTPDQPMGQEPGHGHQTTPEGERTAVGQFLSDAGMTAEIKARHAADDVVSVLNISVETNEGEVQLSGFSPSAAEKARAEEIARSVDGVTQVHNDIVIRAE